MEWEFSAEQVINGEVGYGLQDFRLDLAREVQLNLPTIDRQQCAATYDLLYDLCHWLATGREFDAFLAERAFNPPTCEFLCDMAPTLDANAAMLGAILQRMIMDGVDAGLSLEAALERAAREHQGIVEVLPTSFALEAPS